MRFKFEKQATKAVDNNVMNVTTPALNTSQRESCVFELFVYLSFRENYLANYVQKLR